METSPPHLKSCAPLNSFLGGLLRLGDSLRKMTLNFIRQSFKSSTCLLQKSSPLLMSCPCSAGLLSCSSGLKPASSHLSAALRGTHCRLIYCANELESQPGQLPPVGLKPFEFNVPSAFFHQVTAFGFTVTHSGRRYI